MKISIGAPMAGEIITLGVRVGDTVKKGQTLATIRYIKLSLVDLK